MPTILDNSVFNFDFMAGQLHVHSQLLLIVKSACQETFIISSLVSFRVPILY